MQAADLNLTTDVTGYQRFLFLRLPQGTDAELAGAMDRLGEGMENMHYVAGEASVDAFQRGRFQMLRAEAALSQDRDVPHPAMMEAQGLVRLEAASPDPLLQYEAGLRELIESTGGGVEVLNGVQRPRSYTSHAMIQYAYAAALQAGTGALQPLGAVVPMNKNEAWWSMDWMHRESFFLPRYDQKENLVAKGHALAADAGVPCITRRLVHAADGYGLEGTYDFVGYFEFAEEDAPTFRAVMAGLRDVDQNPEWAYISEGPEWWGRRVGEAAALWEKG